MSNELRDGYEVVPCATWTNDCQGKQDYDGRLLSISTRYWPGPGGGGSMVVDNGPDGLTISTAPYGKRPSASASILMNLGQPDEPDGYADYVKWREADFEAGTEAEVKAQVEAWVKEQIEDLVRILGIDLSKVL